MSSHGLSTFEEREWVVLHGDTARSDIWAVLTDEGRTFDLTGWAVFAQARDDVDDTTPFFSWALGDGIDVGVAKVDVGGRHVRTSTVQLYMRPSDYDDLLRRYSGVVDVEIASDFTSNPMERHTIVRMPFRVEPDVTRSA